MIQYATIKAIGVVIVITFESPQIKFSLSNDRRKETAAEVSCQEVLTMIRDCTIRVAV